MNMMDLEKKEQLLTAEPKPNKPFSSISGIKRLLQHKRKPKKHHIAIGAGTIAMFMAVGFLLIPGKSKKLQATDKVVFELPAPAQAAALLVEENTTLPAISGLANASISALPKSEIIIKPLVTISGNDGIPISNVSGSSLLSPGLFKRSSVQMTKEMAQFVKSLSGYFAENNLQGLITSGVRTSTGQLEIIKQRIAERGMMGSFPGLASASIRDTTKWIAAWEWLKARHVPVNPPADYVNDNGDRVGGSLHLKGLAVDLIANDLDDLHQALQQFAQSPANKANKRGLRVVGLVREADCVHVSLGR